MFSDIPCKFARQWRRIVLVSAAALTAVAVSSGVPGAAAASPATWRVVMTIAPHSTFRDVSASGPRNAWAVGDFCDVTCAPGLLIARWNGQAWTRVASPLSRRALGSGRGTAIATAGRSDTWIFLGGVGSGRGSRTEAIHWNGRGWTGVMLGRIAGVAPIISRAFVFGGSDVWAFGLLGLGPGKPLSYLARFNGSSWQQQAPPLPAVALSASSASDIWTIGRSTSGLASDDAMRWDGRHWHLLPLPVLGTTASPEYLLGENIAAAGPDNVWVVYFIAGQTLPGIDRTGHGSLLAGVNDNPGGLLHWNGHSWRNIEIPFPDSGQDAIAIDGRGGVWLSGDAPGSSVPYVYHYNHGRWSHAALPSGAFAHAYGVVHVPGTTREFAPGYRFNHAAIFSNVS